MLVDVIGYPASLKLWKQRNFIEQGHNLPGRRGGNAGCGEPQETFHAGYHSALSPEEHSWNMWVQTGSWEETEEREDIDTPGSDRGEASSADDRSFFQLSFDLFVADIRSVTDALTADGEFNEKPCRTVKTMSASCG
jgi:hypothetical protein